MHGPCRPVHCLGCTVRSVATTRRRCAANHIFTSPHGPKPPPPPLCHYVHCAALDDRVRALPRRGRSVTRQFDVSSESVGPPALADASVAAPSASPGRKRRGTSNSSTRLNSKGASRTRDSGVSLGDTRDSSRSNEGARSQPRSEDDRRPAGAAALPRPNCEQYLTRG